MDNGFIVIWRKIMEWEWWDDIPTRNVFLTLLLLANHKPRKWRGQLIETGQCVIGRISLAKKSGMTVQNVRTALKNLQSTSELTIKSTNRFSIISIAKWKEYQSKSTSKSTSQLTSNQPATNHKQQCNNVTISNDTNDNSVVMTLPDILVAKKNFCDEEKNLSIKEYDQITTSEPRQNRTSNRTENGTTVLRGEKLSNGTTERTAERTHSIQDNTISYINSKKNLSCSKNLSNFLYSKIKANIPHFIGDPRKWDRDFDLMLRLDKRDPEKARKLIEWCQADEFWRGNILSGNKFRKQYDQMSLRARTGQEHRPPPPPNRLCEYCRPVGGQHELWCQNLFIAEKTGVKKVQAM